MHRRGFIQTAGAAGAVLAGSQLINTAFSRSAHAQELPPSRSGESYYRVKVPEIFEPIPNPPEHSEALIIGSGFGAAVTALRLAEAGVSPTILERGSRWPRDNWRDIFANDAMPDGRAFWHKTTLSSYRATAQGLLGVPYTFDYFGGIFDIVKYDNMEVFRGSCVGGGSMVYTGVSLQPEREYFEQIFQNAVGYDEMNRTYYPRARQKLRVSPVPQSIYESAPFHRHRVWDDVLKKAGFSVQRTDSIFNWNVVQAELQNKVRPSAIIGESDFGNANGAKFDLNQNYLKDAEARGARIFPGHEVQSIAQDSDGRYVVTVRKLQPNGEVIHERRLTCDRLFLGAGSVGTSELLVKAKARNELARLNEHVGTGWGPNGDAMVLHGASPLAGTGVLPASPNASRIRDVSGSNHLSLEGWYLPGVPDMSAVFSLAMVHDLQHTGTFRYASDGSVQLDWPEAGNEAIFKQLQRTNQKIQRANPTLLPTPSLPSFQGLLSVANLDVVHRFTAHPLGGAVVGKATDSYGRVHGHPGLYVMDGAAIPTSTGTVNPSLTITALAERNIENIIASDIRS